ncbi:hypothetical protein MXD62_16780 [Frankia sp. Mgl5]|uniref:hypothetical protein n=1 Tax=Frankia sp. Mgl5 TaxID=2933793 RepID=UPI00200E0047|nr:hypothetical protein [Frankia sp. Mgl5]MCK9928812.1 hypothetical protein [Frankia sp. Mgl5]
MPIILGNPPPATWVPTLTNITLGDGSMGARYLFLAPGAVYYRIFIQFGSTTTVGGTVQVSIPFTPNTTLAQTGHARTFHPSLGIYSGVHGFTSTTINSIIVREGMTDLATAVPYTSWTSGCTIRLWGVAELA